MDIKDIKEDKKNKIYTFPVLYGEKNAVLLSLITGIFSFLLFYT